MENKQKMTLKGLSSIQHSKVTLYTHMGICGRSGLYPQGTWTLGDRQRIWTMAMKSRHSSIRVGWKGDQEKESVLIFIFHVIILLRIKISVSRAKKLKDNRRE